MPANIRKRPDTRYLAETTITTDLSQRHTNLTVSGGGGYEANSDRTAILGEDAGRSIEVACEMTNVSTGVLADHTTGSGYRIRVTAGGVVTFSDSTGSLAVITAPGIAVGAKDYVVAWSTEPNPLTTGAGDALRSEFTVYEKSGLLLSWDAVTHAVGGALVTGTFTVGGVFTGGVMTLAYSDVIDIVRISCRFHTRVETREHFVAQTAAPTVEGLQACQLLPIPPQICEPGAIVGPAYQLGAASMQTGRDRHRLVSPIWQVMAPNAVTFSDFLEDSISPKFVFDSSEIDAGPGWQCPVHWIARRRVPPTVQWLQVRIQIVTFETAPGATDKVEVRLHTSDNLPNHATKTSYQTFSRTVDDGSALALGVWEKFTKFVFVERAVDGYTWLWWSMRTDEGSGTGNASYAIRGWSVTPVVLGEGYDGVQPNQWGP